MTLLKHAASARAPAPSKKWMAQAGSLAESVATSSVSEMFARWASRLDEPRPENDWRHEAPWAHHDRSLALDDRNCIVLKGLCWIVSGAPKDPPVQALESLARSAYRKIPGVGPRSAKVGNAAICALGRIATEPAIAALLSLRARLKQVSVRRMIDRALDSAARARGIRRADVEELGVPTFGMQRVGRLERPIGEHVAMLRFDGGSAAEIRWRSASGRTTRTPPKQVREQHPEALRALRDAARDLKKTAPSQRERLDHRDERA